MKGSTSRVKGESSPLTTTTARRIMLALALFLLGLGWSLCFVAGSALLAQVVADVERGRLQGASESFVSIASGTGSLGAGPLFAISGFWLPAGIGLLLALMLLTTALLSIFPSRPAFAGHLDFNGT